MTPGDGCAPNARVTWSGLAGDRARKRTMAAAGLREGYSTGACAAAVCAAAWRRVSGEAPGEIGVLFPDGVTRTLRLLERRGAENGAAVRKDGGDDPDCTHGAVIYARIRPCAEDEAASQDYVLAVGKGRAILRAVEGIGLCTRPGLDCEPGKWAINVVPRRMIRENLRSAGMNAGVWLVELGVERGGILAEKTLNARLGVLGGLSILGTTGIVRPYSHEAYAATIRLCVRALRREGGRDVVFCTGGRTRTGAMRHLPGLPEPAFVFIGDYIADSLAAAGDEGMRSVTVACMAGKLCKYAAGFDNTHAHRVAQDMALLRREAAPLLQAAGEGHAVLADALDACVSVREALIALPEAVAEPLLRRLATLALDRFAARLDKGLASGAPPVLRLLLFDFEGRFLMDVA